MADNPVFSLITAIRDLIDHPNWTETDEGYRQCMNTIRELGEQLYALGGREAMDMGLEAAEQEIGSRAGVILNSAWDRIGGVWLA